jgi:hypothetical protein
VADNSAPTSLTGLVAILPVAISWHIEGCCALQAYLSLQTLRVMLRCQRLGTQRFHDAPALLVGLLTLL